MARLAWSHVGSLTIVSGAFGLFRRQTVMEVGGYSTQTVGEDFELVLRIHRRLREQRSDYRRADCMMLPFHIITRLQGQPLADLDITNYDLKSVVPAATFTMTATP